MTRSVRIGRKSPGTTIVGAAAAFFLAFALPVAAEDKPPDDPTVATIDGVAITNAELAMAAQEFAQQLSRLPPEQQKAALLDAVIDIELFARAAETQGVDKDPVVAKRLAFTRARALRNEYLRTRVTAMVTEDAVKKRFDEMMTKFVPADQIHVRHILVKTEDEAKAIIADLDKGGDFAKIATEKSQDPGSAAKGGDLGFIGKGVTVKPFEDAAFALEAGAYSKTPVKSDYGWHILKVEEKRKEPPPVLEEQADLIRQTLVRELFTKETTDLRTAAKIDIVPGVLPAPPSPPAADAPATPAEPATPATPATPAEPAAPAQ